MLATSGVGAFTSCPAPYDTLPAGALIFSEDYAAGAERPPRALAEQVMAQIEHPDNLARFTNPTDRLVTLITMVRVCCCPVGAARW